MTDTNDDWYSPETATFGDRVAGARDASGMDQPDLAKRLGVKLSTLKDWEDDLSEPRANKLSMMAGVLGVSLRWLLEGQGDGINGPDDSEPLAADVDALLIEIRQIKGQLTKSGEQLGRVEKQLRKVLKDRHD